MITTEPQKIATAMLRPLKGPATARLVIFPHAGAGPNTYLSLFANLAADIELVGVTAPGRERRFDEPPNACLSTLTTDVASELRAQRRKSPLPTTFFGHSMGAMVALVIAASDPSLCKSLIVSSSPACGDVAALPATLGTASDRRNLLAKQGLPVDLLDDPEFFARAQHLLDADLEVSKSALRITQCAKLNVPVTAFAAQSDDLVSLDAVREWRHHTSETFRLHQFGGDHFYLFDPEHSAEVSAQILSALARE